MAKVSLTQSFSALDLAVSDVHLAIDDKAHQQTEGGFEALGAVSPKIEEVFDELALVVGTVLDTFPASPSLIETYLEGLKGAIIQYLLLFSAANKR